LVTGPGGESLYERQAAEIIHPASTIKIAIGMLAMEMLVRKDPELRTILDGGPPTVGRSYAQLLKAMIVSSEEDAAQALQDAVVADLGWKEIDHLLMEWGAPDTRLVPRRSSAADLTHLLMDLYARGLPSQGSSRYILRLMAEVTGGDTGRIWKLKAQVPPGTMIFNKRGTLLDPMVVADIGIVDIPGQGPYYLCILGYPSKDETYEYLDQRIGDFAVAWFQSQFSP
jgi:beta-lactamase class A